MNSDGPGITIGEQSLETKVTSQLLVYIYILN